MSFNNIFLIISFYIFFKFKDLFKKFENPYYLSGINLTNHQFNKLTTFKAKANRNRNRNNGCYILCSDQQPH